MSNVDRQVLRQGGLLLLILLAFAIRISGLTAQSLWRDEVDALRFSQEPLTTLVSNFARQGWNGPLFYVFFRYWVDLVGSSEFSLRYFSLWFGVLSVGLVYRLGRVWFSPLVGGVGTLLAACSPYMVWYAQEAKMYALLCALALGTLLLYHYTLKGEHWRLWTVIVALTWVTAGTHVLGTLLIPVMVSLFFVWWPISRRQWRQALVALGGTLLPGILVARWVFSLLVRGGNIGHPFIPLPEMFTTMLYAFSQGILDIGGLWPVGLVVFALLAGSTLWPHTDVLSWLWGIARGERGPLEGRPQGEHRYVLAAWVWMVLPVLGLFAISLRVPMFVDRYLIWIGPALYLLVARGLDQVRRRSALLSSLCLAAILVGYGWGVWAQSSMPIKSDFRAASAYVRQHRQPEDLILFHISYVRQTFEYYYGDSSPATGGVPTDERTTGEAVDAAMRDRTDGYDVVWLVLSEPEMWDQRGMTVAWLDAYANPEMRGDFERVSVIRYRIAGDVR